MVLIYQELLAVTMLFVTGDGKKMQLHNNLWVMVMVIGVE
jgi:hypothetical protein